MARQAIFDQTTYERWYDEFNSEPSNYNKKRSEFDLNFKRKMAQSIRRNEFFLVKEFLIEIDNTTPAVSSSERDRRLKIFKRFLNKAIDQANDEVLDVFNKDNLDKGDFVNVLTILNDGDYTVGVAPTGRHNHVKSVFRNFFEEFGNRNNENALSSIGFGPDPVPLDDVVEELAKEGSSVLVDQYDSGFKSDNADDSSDPSNEDNQCLLMSMIFDKDSYIRKSKGYASDTQRVLSFWSSDDNDTINNKLVSNEGLKKFFKVKQQQNNFIKQLSLVKEVEYFDSTGKKDNFGRFVEPSTYQTFEFPLTFSIAELNKSRATQVANLETKIANYAGDPDYETQVQQWTNQREELFLKQIKDSNSQHEANFLLESFNIKYEGTNPSTARDDVKVTIKFKLESFSALKHEIGKYFDKVDTSTNRANTDEGLSITLGDLVLQGLGGTPQESHMASLKNTYAPSNSRLRLKIKADDFTVGNVTYYSGPPLILDLTTIDHEISRTAEDGAVNFTINYRGYFHSMLTMPFTDIVASRKTMYARENRRKNLSKLLQDEYQCKTETLREMLRVERSSFELENNDSRFEELLNWIYTNYGIYKSTFDFSKFSREQCLQNIPKAGDKKIVKTELSWTGKGFGSSTGNTDYSDALKIAVAEEEISVSVKKSQCTWVSLGAIIEAAIRHLYENSNNKGSRTYNPSNPKSGVPRMAEHLSNVNLRIGLMPLAIPNPKDGIPIYIHLAQMPIDIKLFAEFWNETVIKKDLKIYPAGSFIRDLIERLINNLLFEVCLSHLLPDETPPRMRCQSFVSRYAFANSLSTTLSAAERFGSSGEMQGTMQPTKAGGYCDLDASFSLARADKSGDSIPKAPYFTEEVKKMPVYNTTTSGFRYRILNTYNYLLIYQQSAPLLREVNANRDTTLKETNFIPTIVHGLHSKEWSQIETVSFTKNTAPFLREARYHNNNFGGLAIMNNVYDITLTMKNNHANTFFYPGMIINFILTDFSDQTTNISLINDPTPNSPSSGDETAANLRTATTIKIMTGSANIVTPDNYMFTNNDPHNSRIYNSGGETIKNNTPAYLLGFGGYYTIKSVDYDIQNADAYWTITIVAKFTGTDFDTVVKRTDAITSIENDSNKCIAYYRNAVSVNEYLAQDYGSNLDAESSFEFAAYGNQEASLESGPTYESELNAPKAIAVQQSSTPQPAPTEDELFEFADAASLRGSEKDSPDGLWVQFEDNGVTKYVRIPMDSTDNIDQSKKSNLNPNQAQTSEPTGNVQIFKYDAN